MPLSLLADRAAERWPVKSYISIIASLSMGKRPFSRKNCNIFCNLVAFSRFGRQIRGTGGPGGQRFGKGAGSGRGTDAPRTARPRQRTVNDRQAVSPRRMQATLRRLLTARQPCEEKRAAVFAGRCVFASGTADTPALHSLRRNATICSSKPPPPDVLPANMRKKAFL